MTPWLRKLALTVHVTLSIGWIGAVVGFLALAVAGLTSTQEQMVRSAYLSMDLIGWRVVVPLCIASLLSGLIQAVATPWGLFRHWWVMLKLAVTLALTLLLVVHMQPTRRLAAVAAESAIAGAELHQLQTQLAVDAASALVALLALVVLAVYKPRGSTRYGARKAGTEPPVRAPRWVKVFAVSAVAFLLAVKALSGSGAHHGHFGHAGATGAALHSARL